jgi:hypothetical protein
LKDLLPKFAAILLLVPVSLAAQQQEKKLLERINRPYMELGSHLQSKSYQGAAGLKIQGSPVSDKTFETPQSRNMKEFQGSRSFLGIKNPWFGQLTYDAKPASLSPRGGAEVSKSYSVKPAAVTSYAASSRSANSAKPQVPLQPFVVQGEAQGAMQQISDRVKKEMTIDDVRELLNKPR